jgi:hypothetical protein
MLYSHFYQPVSIGKVPSKPIFVASDDKNREFQRFLDSGDSLCRILNYNLWDKFMHALAEKGCPAYLSHPLAI